MPQNGEANPKFGLYKSVCCREEIIINAGSTFPDCPNHPNVTTIWKPVVDGKHIENRVLFNLAAGRIKLEEQEQQHLHVCKVCQGVLYVFVQLPVSPPTEDPPKTSGVA